MKLRCEDTTKNLKQILEDLKKYPINYNHYYTETVEKRCMDREFNSLAVCVENATTYTLTPECRSTHTFTHVDPKRLRREISQSKNPNMDIHSCKSALDGLLAMYKVCTTK